ncbi:bifunctional diguanylate cyclase/phosphodiesterase [Alicyclobacillus sp. SO9]|uniref:putative bifunctional diguanylate cyclase/phosphodiesterase n=1 Tax=Alicyclobacillus sp. SO9 TaxID=2665646 RepID=UPI001E49EBEA|nr:EAL domain-containing protein [Alicyclobacillus sp. SO9]
MREGSEHREARLYQSEDWYRNLVELSPQAIVVHVNGEIIYANPAAVTLLGVPEARDLLGYSIFDLVDPNEREQLIYRSDHAMAKEGNTIELMEHVISFQGRILTVEGMGVGIRYDGHPAVQLFIRDITERKRAEQATRYAEDLLRGQNAVLNLIAQGTEVRETLTEIVSQIESKSPHRRCRIFVESGNHHFYVGSRNRINNNLWSKSLLSSSGATIGNIDIHNVFASPPTQTEIDLYDTYSQLAELAIRQWLAAEEISRLAYRDPLTNLPNRRVVEDTFTSLVSSTPDKLCAVMMLDIDRFKWINDTFGHDVGDQIIKVIANRLIECVGADDVVSRTGGDEFTIVVCDDCSREELWLLGEEILQSVQETVAVGEHEFSLTISVGIALYPKHGLTLKDLLKNADSAMYDAKAKGRNAISIYALRMNDKFEDRLILEHDIRHAFEHEEFVIEYQPKVDLGSYRITGAEALLRWFHPTRGMVSPDDFVKVAEDMGLIDVIGQWVLETVLKQLQDWDIQGARDVPIAVNVSAHQFVQPAFADFVGEALQRYRVQPQLLELEITETAFMTNIEVAAKNIRYLARMGVKIIFDDFGTGYSSLSLLNSFEIDSLKIDRSFVEGLSWRDATCESILISIISLGQSLGMNLIAEGVEDEEQLRFLKERDCNEAQGYLFSKSLSASALERLLTDNEPLRIDV